LLPLIPLFCSSAEIRCLKLFTALFIYVTIRILPGLWYPWVIISTAHKDKQWVFPPPGIAAMAHFPPLYLSTSSFCPFLSPTKHASQIILLCQYLVKIFRQNTVIFITVGIKHGFKGYKLVFTSFEQRPYKNRQVMFLIFLFHFLGINIILIPRFCQNMDIGYLLDASWSPAVAANTQKYHYFTFSGLDRYATGVDISTKLPLSFSSSSNMLSADFIPFLATSRKSLLAFLLNLETTLTKILHCQ